MALLEATRLSVYNHSAPYGIRMDSGDKKHFTCLVSGYFSGTYVQNDNARFTAVTTAIADSLRNGATIALLGACFAEQGDEAGTAIGAKTVAVSGANITMELTGADMSTEHAGAALGTMNEPIALCVTYSSTL
jgi:hypothetical protein